MNPEKITVVVCTFNRCQSLATTLNSLAAQVFPESTEWEILVVDNNSSDRTRQVVDDVCRQNPGRFRYLLEPRQGKSLALNSGIREAKGDLVAFTDDDVTADPMWLHNLTANLRKRECAGTGGRTLPERGFVPPHWLGLDRQFALAPLGLFDMGDEAQELTTSPFGNNMAFRKKVIEKYGGFRSDLGPRAGSSCPQKSEDSEFGVRLLEAGERLLYEPSAIIYHCIPQGRVQKNYFLDWWFDKARSDIQAFGVPDPRWCVAGIPARLFRRLAAWTVRWMFAVKPSRKFDCQLKVWAEIAEIRECFRVALEARTSRDVTSEGRGPAMRS